MCRQFLLIENRLLWIEVDSCCYTFLICSRIVYGISRDIEFNGVLGGWSCCTGGFRKTRLLVSMYGVTRYGILQHSNPQPLDAYLYLHFASV